MAHSHMIPPNYDIEVFVERDWEGIHSQGWHMTQRLCAVCTVAVMTLNFCSCGKDRSERVGIHLWCSFSF
jgi:hypothetical protein